MTKVNTAKSIVAKAALELQSREDLAATAIALGLPVKSKTSKTAIVSALVKAGDEGKAHIKMDLTISHKPEGGFRTTYFGCKVRNYVSGPGEGNTVWLTPLNAIQGSPSTPGE